jgi:hypothetical protein
MLGSSDDDVEIGGGPAEGRPDRPNNALPPLPPGFRPDNALPIAPARPAFPIVIPVPPDATKPIEPGTIWPPLNPSDGVAGKCLLLIVVVGASGSGYRWLAVDAPEINVPTPAPK